LGEYNDVVKGRFINGQGEIVTIYRKIEPYPTNNMTLNSLLTKDLELGMKIYFITTRNLYVDGQLAGFKTNLDEFKLVGFLAPNKEMSAVIPYEDALKIMRREMLEYLNKSDVDKMLPLYNLIYVYVDDLDYVDDVAYEIQRLYPDAQVFYGWGKAKLLSEILLSSSNYIAFISNLLIGINILLIGVARYIEGIKYKVEYGLLEAMDWSKRDVFIYILIYSLSIGFIAGLFTSILTIIAYPYVTNIASPVGAGVSPEIREHLTNIIALAASSAKESLLILLNPILGAALCGLTSLIPYLIFSRKDLDEILRDL